MAVKSSRVVFEVLPLIARSGTPLGAADVARALFVPVSTAARALATLEAAGYVLRDGGSARFVLGHAGQRLAYSFMSRFPIRDLALPYLQQLTLLSGHSSSLFVRLGWYSVRIALIVGTGSLVNVGAIGEARPLTVGAPSSAIVAGLSRTEAERAAAHHGEPALALLQRRTRVREQGYAVDASAIEGGGYDLAFPLADPEDAVPAAVVSEGMASDPADARDAVETSREVIAPLQAIVAREASSLASPYGYIDPDTIRFG